MRSRPLMWLCGALLLAGTLVLAGCDDGGGGSDASPVPEATLDPTSLARTQEAINTEEASDNPTPTRVPAPADAPTRTSGEVVLIITPSLEQSGLVAALLPAFESETGLSVTAVALAPAEAVARASAGSADILLADPSPELFAYTGADTGIVQRKVFHEDFVLLGPAADPAGVADQERTDDAFRAIAEAAAPYISAGSEGEMYTFEVVTWARAGWSPESQPWYSTAPDALAAASAQGAYTLTSRRTFASLPAALQIQPLLEADPTLLRTYSIILVNPENAPGVNATGASALADYLVRPDVQQVISEFRVAQSATQVFFPQPQ